MLFERDPLLQTFAHKALVCVVSDRMLGAHRHLGRSRSS